MTWLRLIPSEAHGNVLAGGFREVKLRAVVALSAFELRLALFHERTHAFLLILAREAQRKEINFRVEPFTQIHSSCVLH